MNGDGNYLCEMKEMQKNESKSAQWKLGAAANGGSRKLVEGFQLWGRNGVKMASPLPFLCLQKILCKVVLFIVIFSL